MHHRILWRVIFVDSVSVNYRVHHARGSKVFIFLLVDGLQFQEALAMLAASPGSSSVESSATRGIRLVNRPRRRGERRRSPRHGRNLCGFRWGLRKHC